MKFQDRVAITSLNIEEKSMMQMQIEIIIITYKLQLDILYQRINRAKKRNNIDVIAKLEEEEAALMQEIKDSGSPKPPAKNQKFFDLVNYRSTEL